MSDLRVGDVERERAAASLAEHAAVGRLDPEEHAERLDAVWTARTQGDLAVLFDDLPGQGAQLTQHHPHQAGPGRRPGPGWRPVPFVPLAILLVVLSVVTHLPFWVGIFFLGCGLFSRARRASRRTSSPASASW
ncbi:DUF1707 domain-containing protein [Nocardioides sp.]|uniref:DUF1707 SHOCT-like domain-containing protein n=1 Tax=Nocardioides sp. TaxID=35761 RepID=UPI0027195F75|nr:DUF1707 domain-containing protein [Nocardioides sp.]MDO9456235.1 DUF1707 domain-containing protein [Nocardioides sp.]